MGYITPVYYCVVMIFSYFVQVRVVLAAIIVDAIHTYMVLVRDVSCCYVYHYPAWSPASERDEGSRKPFSKDLLFPFTFSIVSTLFGQGSGVKNIFSRSL